MLLFWLATNACAAAEERQWRYLVRLWPSGDDCAGNSVH